MLFYTTTENMKQVPTSYICVLVSKPIVAGPATMVHCPDLVPDMIDDTDKKMKISEYVKRLKNEKLMYVVSIARLLFNKSHVVLIYNPDDKDAYGFNFCKILTVFIEKRYGYPAFKFTNDITLDMKQSCKFDFDGETNYMKDLKKFSKELRKK